MVGWTMTYIQKYLKLRAPWLIALTLFMAATAIARFAFGLSEYAINVFVWGALIGIVITRIQTIFEVDV